MRGETFEGKPCIHGHGITRYVLGKACVICSAEWSAKYNASLSPERIIERKEYGVLRHKNSPLISRSKHWRALGIDEGAAKALLAAHDDKCDCCGRSGPGKKGWNIDHDHKTGKVRGVLCSGCNAGIGMLGDNLDGVLRAADYLRRTT